MKKRAEKVSERKRAWESQREEDKQIRRERERDTVRQREIRREIRRKSQGENEKEDKRLMNRSWLTAFWEECVMRTFACSDNHLNNTPPLPQHPRSTALR